MFSKSSYIKHLIKTGVITTPELLKAAGKNAAKHDDCHSHADKWKRICLYGIIPGVVAFAIFVFSTLHEHERTPFVKYDYLRIRNKRFPWGDGRKSFWHNPKINALPDGYED